MFLQIALPASFSVVSVAIFSLNQPHNSSSALFPFHVIVRRNTVSVSSFGSMRVDPIRYILVERLE